MILAITLAGTAWVAWLSAALSEFRLSDLVLALPVLAAFGLVPVASLTAIWRGRAWGPALAVRGLPAVGVVALLYGGALLGAQVAFHYWSPDATTARALLAGLITAGLSHLIALVGQARRRPYGRLFTTVVAIFWIGFAGLGLSIGALTLWLVWRKSHVTGSTSQNTVPIRWALAEVLFFWPAGIAMILLTSWPKRVRGTLAVLLAGMLGLLSVAIYQRIGAEVDSAGIRQLQASMVRVELVRLKANGLLVGNPQAPDRIASLNQLRASVDRERSRLRDTVFPETLQAYRASVLAWAAGLSERLREVGGAKTADGQRAAWMTVDLVPRPFTLALSADESGALYAKTVSELDQAVVEGKAAVKSHEANAWWPITATLETQSVWIQSQLRGRGPARDLLSLRLLAATPAELVQYSLPYADLLQWVLAAIKVSTQGEVTPTAPAVAAGWAALSANATVRGFKAPPSGAVELFRCLNNGGTVVGEYDTGLLAQPPCRMPTSSPLELVAPLALPVGVAGEQYVGISFTARGGLPPYVFQRDPTKMGPPLMMSIDLNGRLSGIPSQPGYYSFGVCVTDGQGIENCVTSGIVVQIGLKFSPPAVLPAWVLGQPSSFDFTPFAPQSASFAWIGDTPPGVYFDQHYLWGTPTRVGTYSFKVCAQAPGTVEVCQPVSLTVRAPGLAPVPAQPQTGSGSSSQSSPSFAITGPWTVHMSGGPFYVQCNAAGICQYGGGNWQGPASFVLRISSSGATIDGTIAESYVGACPATFHGQAKWLGGVPSISGVQGLVTFTPTPGSTFPTGGPCTPYTAPLSAAPTR